MVIAMRPDVGTPTAPASDLTNPDEIARQVRALQTENAALRALLALQGAPGRAASASDTVSAAIEHLRTTLGADRAYGLLCAAASQRLVPAATAPAGATELRPDTLAALARALDLDQAQAVGAMTSASLPANLAADLGPGEVLLAPLRGAASQPVGLLVFEYDRVGETPSQVSPERLQLAAVVAAQVGLLLERALLDEQLARRTSRLEALNEIGLGLAAHATGEPAKLFRYLHPRLAAVLDGAGYFLAVRDEGRASMTVWSAVNGRVRQPYRELPLGDDALSAAVRGGQRASFATAAALESSGALPGALGGLAPELAAPGSAIYAPLRLRQRTLGALAVVSGQPHDYTEGHVEFLGTVAAQTAVTLEHGRLNGLLRARGEVRQRLLDQTLQAQEAERKHLVDGILDGALQELASCSYRLDLCLRLSELGQHDRSREELRQTRRQLAERIEELRATVAALRPSSLDHLGLQSVLRDELASFGASHGIRAEFRTRVKERLAPAVETRAYRIAQELLNNVRRHAGASLVRVELLSRGDDVILSISDNGQGFDAEEALSSQQGMGLHGVREQAELLGGTVRVQSRRGAGTRVDVAFPRGTLAGVGNQGSQRGIDGGGRGGRRETGR